MGFLPTPAVTVVTVQWKVILSGKGLRLYSAQFQNYAYQNKVTSQNTMSQVQFVTGILLIFAKAFKCQVEFSAYKLSMKSGPDDMTSRNGRF